MDKYKKNKSVLLPQNLGAVSLTKWPKRKVNNVSMVEELFRHNKDNIKLRQLLMTLVVEGNNKSTKRTGVVKGYTYIQNNVGNLKRREKNCFTKKY